MVTPKKIIMKDLELADKEIARLRKENKELEQAINELMVQCDIKYFRFRDKEFYKQEYDLNSSSKKK